MSRSDRRHGSGIRDPEWYAWGNDSQTVSLITDTGHQQVVWLWGAE